MELHVHHHENKYSGPCVQIPFRRQFSYKEKWSKTSNFQFEPEEQLPKDLILISDKSITENESEVK